MTRDQARGESAAVVSAPLLIPEPALQVLPTLAEIVGINESIVLQQIHYWSLHKIKAGEDPWVYNTQQDWLAEFPWMSLRTFQRVIEKLDGLELLLIKQPEGTNRRAHYLVQYAKLPHSEHAKMAASTRQNGGLSNTTETSSEKTSKSPKTPNKRTVNRKAVTDGELALAAVVVELFNSSAGTALSVDAHLTPIVGRIREKPEYEERQHRAIIEAVFAGEHWWTGPPTPRVIYGNPAIFEQSIELARARAKEGKADSDPNAERRRVEREFREAEAEDAGD